MSRVAVVSDSAATLPDDRLAAAGVEVVPLQVVIGSRSFDDGIDEEAGPANVAAALRAHVPVGTSRVSPTAFLDRYDQLAAQGVAEIVSVHLSGEVSGTVESAQLAARQSSVPVRVVDSRQIGAATGYAALAAARCAAAGGSGAEAAAAAEATAAAATTLFYVDTLEYLRRGGRVGAAAALLGQALAVRPILSIGGGRVVPLEKVRTSARALARLEELVVAAVGDDEVELCVCALDNRVAAEALTGSLTQRLGDRVPGGVQVGLVPAVVGAHVGPGIIGVAVAPA